MTAIALVVALALLTALAVLQILAASGLPLGRFVWGGQHRVYENQYSRAANSGSFYGEPRNAVFSLKWKM